MKGIDASGMNDRVLEVLAHEVWLVPRRDNSVGLIAFDIEDRSVGVCTIATTVGPPTCADTGIWRREGDSNPRSPEAQRFSRPSHSSALPSLRPRKYQRAMVGASRHDRDASRRGRGVALG